MNLNVSCFSLSTNFVSCCCLLVLISNKCNGIGSLLPVSFLTTLYCSKKKRLLFLFLRVFSIKTLGATWGKKNSVICTRKKKELLNGKKLSWVEYTQKVKKERNNKNVHTYVHKRAKVPLLLIAVVLWPLPPCLFCDCLENKNKLDSGEWIYAEYSYSCACISLDISIDLHIYKCAKKSKVVDSLKHYR